MSPIATASSSAAIWASDERLPADVRYAAATVSEPSSWKPTQAAAESFSQTRRP